MTGVKAKVLVVDDNEDFCENIRDLLELHGYQAAAAFSGLKAVEIVKQDPPDIVLLDVRMPGMDGLATFRKIREIVRGAAVIMITGYSDESIIEEASREGARGWMRKPLDMPQFLEAVAKALSCSA